MRVRLVYGGVPRLVTPTVGSDLVLTREPGQDGAFYTRDKLTGGPFVFSGADFALLNAINRSVARCQVLGLLVDHRGSPGMSWETWAGSFTCNDCTGWNETTCTVSLQPTSADPYEKLLQHYDKQFNLLLTPTARRTVTAALADLADPNLLEFCRAGTDEQADLLGQDGWTLFLQNTSWIPTDSGLTLTDGFHETNNILFRYRLRKVPMAPVAGGGFTVPDKSSQGYQPLFTTYDGTAGTIDYTKEPAIAGFKVYKIGTYNDWNDPRNRAAYRKYGPALLLVDGSGKPSDYGYRNADYVEVTGPDGYGANNAECQGGTTLQVRRYKSDQQCSRLFWRFGTFPFTRCIPLLDGLYNLLAQTTLPYGGGTLLPPTPAQLSHFFSDDLNQATGQSGAANELPRLVLVAGSDAKRPQDSEAATRLLLSLKELLTDVCGLYDAGWFIDPATGWLRVEHRAYFEAQQGSGGEVDLQGFEDAQLSNAYDYLLALLPRYEELAISNASTEDTRHQAYFTKASLDYGLSGCVNQHEGQNRVSTAIGRLTGDVAAAVLNGDQLPDTALFVLAPDPAGQLPDANRALAANNLLLRYYTRGRAAFTATVEPPAPAVAPNTVTGDLPPAGPPAPIVSVRPPRQQVSPVSGRLLALAILAPTAHYTTNLGTQGLLAKAELNLRTRMLKTTVQLPALVEMPAPPIGGRQFDDSFDASFA